MAFRPTLWTGNKQQHLCSKEQYGARQLAKASRERAETRRKEARQRKQKSEDKRLYKQWAQELLSILDRNRHRCLGNLYIWTDALPLGDEEDEGCFPTVRAERRSASLDVQQQSAKEARADRGATRTQTRPKKHIRAAKKSQKKM